MCIDYLTRVALENCQEVIRERDRLRRENAELHARIVEMRVTMAAAEARRQ